MEARCIAVAWSGGRDSTALLHATLKAAEPLGVPVVALHVHHGLSPHADEWLQFCEAQSRRWRRRGLDVVLHVVRLAGHPARGDSVEAWARAGRYRALRHLALEQGARAVLLAHHRRDQAETVLLQALRGAGVAGLAGMPATIERDGVLWCRPWLTHGDAAIAAYVRRYRLRHVEDDSNADPRFARNRLRESVWPSLLESFPDAEGSLADSARWAAEADACLAEIAREDLAGTVDAQGLLLAPLFALSPVRRRNALRHWLRAQLRSVPPASLLARLDRELVPQGHASWLVPNGVLRSHRGVLSVTSEVERPDEGRVTDLCIDGAGTYPLPGWGGALVVRRVEQGGVPLAWLAVLDLRARGGAEQFQAGLGRPPRSLKKQFQAAGVPAWQRNGPLVYSGGQLVFVPGLGLDARVIGLPGQPQVELAWLAG